MTNKTKDPFGFNKAINFKIIDTLSDEKLDEIAKMFDLSPSDFSDDKQDLRDFAEILQTKK